MRKPRRGIAITPEEGLDRELVPLCRILLPGSDPAPKQRHDEQRQSPLDEIYRLCCRIRNSRHIGFLSLVSRIAVERAVKTTSTANHLTSPLRESR